MGIRVQFDQRAIRRMTDQFIDGLVDAKVEQLQDLAKANFRNDTGELFRSIRREGNSVVIGDRDTGYWRYVLKYRRGDGYRWVRQVLTEGNEQAMREAARGR